MSEWSFLRSRRWAGYLALVVLFAVVCCALGTWQFNRRAEALAEIARIDANYDADPVPVADALADPASFDIDQRWVVVGLSGEYLPEEEVLVRNRPFQGGAGFEVLTPVQLDDGTVFIVDRGFVAQDSEGGPSEFAAPPTGEVEVSARLKAGEDRIAGRTSAGDVLATIDLDELAERLDRPTYTGAYGLLIQDATDAAEPPVAHARPIRDEGPHLSYALQWFVFALMAFVGLGWAANQERRSRAEAWADGASDQSAATTLAGTTAVAGTAAASGTSEATGTSAPASRPDRGRRPAPMPRASKRRGGHDADVEDAILDATPPGSQR